MKNQTHARNLNFEEKAQEIGATYDTAKQKWIAHELAEKEFQDLEDYYFSNMKIVEVCGKFEYSAESYKEYRHIAGYILATVTSKNSGAKKSDSIIVLNGGFTSAGSIKNYFCTQKENTKIRMRISESVLKEIEENEDLRNRYEIFIAREIGDNIDLESLSIRHTDEEVLQAMKIIANAGKERIKELTKIFQ